MTHADTSAETAETSGPDEGADAVLDASGLACPLPVLKTRKRLKSMRPGEVLVVLATDPASYVDIPHFCNVSGNDLLDWREDDGNYRYRIQKADD